MTAKETDVHVHGNPRSAMGGASEPHVVPIPVYLAVFAALMMGTYLTVWAAGKDFGAFNTVVALGIAVTKATLVILFFMHVKYSPRLTQMVVATAVAFLALLVVGTLTDYYSPGVDGRLQPAHIQRQ
jgi:cytochrome c oxidase subunit IV